MNETALHKELSCNMQWYCKVMNGNSVTILKVITVANLKVI